MTYRLYAFHTYYRDSPTGGYALEGDGFKSWFGTRDNAKEFATTDEAWEWLGIDPKNLPEDELVEGDNLDDQYTRTVTGAGDVVTVVDTPTTEFFSSSRIVTFSYKVQEVE